MSVKYYVQYAFGGFTGLVAPRPTVNRMQAGRAVAIQFELGGNYGVNVLAGPPTTGVLKRDASATVRDVARTTTATQMDGYRWRSRSQCER